MSNDADDGWQGLEGFGAESDEMHKDRDGARSLRDVQEESGDEDEVDDVYALDRREAADAAVALDRADGPEAALS